MHTTTFAAVITAAVITKSLLCSTSTKCHNVHTNTITQVVMHTPRKHAPRKQVHAHACTKAPSSKCTSIYACARARTHACTHARTHAHADAQTHKHDHTKTQTRTPTNTHARLRTCAYLLTYSRTHTRSLAKHVRMPEHAHVRMNACTHARITHTRVHTLRHEGERRIDTEFSGCMLTCGNYCNKENDFEGWTGAEWQKM